MNFGSVLTRIDFIGLDYCKFHLELVNHKILVQRKNFELKCRAIKELSVCDNNIQPKPVLLKFFCFVHPFTVDFGTSFTFVKKILFHSDKTILLNNRSLKNILAVAKTAIDTVTEMFGGGQLQTFYVVFIHPFFLIPLTKLSCTLS